MSRGQEVLLEADGIATEIVKARLFASVADLIRVRGIGPKTIEKLKGLVTV